jgi:hypothetical protein
LRDSREGHYRGYRGRRLLRSSVLRRPSGFGARAVIPFLPSIDPGSLRA